MDERSQALSVDWIKDQLSDWLPRDATLINHGGYLGRSVIYEVVELQIFLKIFLRNSSDRFSREYQAFELLKNARLSSVEVSRTGRFSNGVHWLATKKIHGENLESVLPQLPNRAISSVYAEMGDYLARQHDISVPQQSALSKQRDLLARFRKLVTYIAKLNLKNASMHERAAALGWKIAHALESTERVLIHRDFSSRNCLVLQKDRVIQLSGVIDYELALAGDPMEDLAKLALKDFLKFPSAKPAFLGAYKQLSPLNESDQDRFLFFVVYLSFEIFSWSASKDNQYFRQTQNSLEAAINRDPLFNLLE
ncbi:MAG: aminoglycoside phosphotransferase family protein [Henriciella sp.]